MVLATFWCSYIAAYKLWKYFFGTDSTALANMILQQSLRNNNLIEHVKKEQFDMNTITVSTGNDNKVAVELEPTSGIAHACEMAVDMETVPAFVPEFSILFESVTAVGHDIPFEMETVDGSAHEFTLEVESVSAFVPEFAILFESVTATGRDIPFQVETVNGIAHEFSLEVETVSAFVPEFSFELERVSAVTEIPLEEEIVTGIAHEFATEETTASAFVPEFSFELERVSAVTEIPLEEEIVTGIAHEFATEVTHTVSAFVPEFSFELESVSAVTKIPLEDEIVTGITHEFAAEVKTVSAFTNAFAVVVETVSEIVDDIPFTDEFQISCIAEECAVEVDSSASESPLITLSPKAQPFVPQVDPDSAKRSLYGNAGDECAATPNREETGITGVVELPVTLNTQAKEFVPSKNFFIQRKFQSSSSGYPEATSVTNNNESGTTGRIEHAVALNAQAKEFVPSSGEAICGAAAAVSNREELGISETERSLNVFAREFVSSDFQNNAAAQSRNPLLEPVMAPVHWPAHSAPGFRPLGQVTAQNGPPVWGFPLNHPRASHAPFHDAQQVQSSYVMRPSWSYAHRNN